MELEILKKKLSTFKTEGGRTRNVSDDLLLEVLSAWEHWTGTSRAFYKGIGVSSKGISSILGKAKRLKRQGSPNPFQEVSVENSTHTDACSHLSCDIELQENNKVIRFGKVDLLIEYLKKAA